MAGDAKLLLQILRGTSDANIPFEGLIKLLQHLGFEERIKGSHHIFTKEGRGRDSQPTAKGRESETLSGDAGSASDPEI